LRVAQAGKLGDGILPSTFLGKKLGISGWAVKTQSYYLRRELGEDVKEGKTESAKAKTFEGHKVTSQKE